MTPAKADATVRTLVQRDVPSDDATPHFNPDSRSQSLKSTARQSTERAATAESGLGSPGPVKSPIDADTSITDDPEQVESVFSKMSQEELIRAIDENTSGLDRSAPTELNAGLEERS